MVLEYEDKNKEIKCIDMREIDRTRIYKNGDISIYMNHKVEDKEKIKLNNMTIYIKDFEDWYLEGVESK